MRYSQYVFSLQTTMAVHLDCYLTRRGLIITDMTELLAMSSKTDKQAIKKERRKSKKAVPHDNSEQEIKEMAEPEQVIFNGRLCIQHELSRPTPIHNKTSPEKQKVSTQLICAPDEAVEQEVFYNQFYSKHCRSSNY